MRHNFLKKKSKQPVTAWSAGCVFKNPAPDMSAGKLLEQAGFKGKKLGGMAFSSLHANFLINEGEGQRHGGPFPAAGSAGGRAAGVAASCWSPRSG